MKISVKAGALEQEKTELLVVNLFEERLPAVENNLDKALQGFVKKVRDKGDFKGEYKQTLLLYPQGGVGAERVLLVGLGKTRELDREKLRAGSATAVRRAKEIGVKTFTFVIPGIGRRDLPMDEKAWAVVEGALLSGYQLTEYKTEDRDKIKEISEVRFLVEKRQDLAAAQRGAKKAETISEAVNWTRTLANYPGNKATPTFLAQEARKLAKEEGLSCRILEKAEMEKLGMGTLLAVAQGSQQPPKFIILEHKPSGRIRGTYAVVGKGITFDSGGISIKPSKSMEEMKYDMCGAAATLGLARVAARLKLPFHLIFLAPATENLPSGTAVKPGDVVRSLSGKTVEIINTDAEGRLILADALAYAQRYKPDGIIDMATLTGAVVVALGHHATGMLGNNDPLKRKVRRAGEECGEKVWELPLWKEHYEQIKSSIADIKNVGNGGGGTITAAAFLGKFVSDVPWVHLDIAGTAWSETGDSWLGKGSTGVGVRLLTRFLLNEMERKK